MRVYTKEWYEFMQLHPLDAPSVVNAEEGLSRQQIPERIESAFRFHDNELLSFLKRGNTYEMLLQKGYGWSEEEQNEGITPYIKIIFTDGVLLEREAKQRLRTRIDEDGNPNSNCIYLYDELYSVPGGYEVHMLFYILEAQNRLAYLTIRCSDIHFEDNITLPKAET